MDETSKSHQTKNDLQTRFQFERVLSELSAKFVRLESSEIDNQIERGLRSLVDVLNVDRCSLAQFSGDMEVLPVTHTYSKPGVRLLSSAMLNIEIPWYVKKIKKGEIVSVPVIDDLPKEAEVDKKWLIQHNTISNLLIPLNVGQSPLGLMGLATTRETRYWPSDLIQRLQLAGEVFANALMRKRKDQELIEAFTRINLLKEKLEVENVYLRDEVESCNRFQEIIGDSPAIKKVLSQIEKVAGTDSTVLISGETGTGKELIARAVHNNSKRQKRTMIKINCAAIPPTLIESELFGREKGAYTGATKMQIGRFEMANESTLFLDEITEMPFALQAKLLRVLQEKQFERLGGNKTIDINVRIIAATNQNISEKIKAGKFRQDLFYRINVFPLDLPPLRDRIEDIPLLVEHFVDEFRKVMTTKCRQVSEDSIKSLMHYSWPGNIRELRNVIERAMILNTGSTLHINLSKGDVDQTNLLTLDDIIRNHIIRILNSTNWVVSGKKGAATVLGIPPTTLESKMKKLGIVRPALKHQIDT